MQLRCGSLGNACITVGLLTWGLWVNDTLGVMAD